MTEDYKLSCFFVRFQDTSTCSNIETDVSYLNYILNYKDNVNSTNDCCDFCNANIRCVIWSLDLDINRCWLKYDRGARVVSNGISSGFSASCKTLGLFFECRLTSSEMMMSCVNLRLRQLDETVNNHGSNYLNTCTDHHHTGHHHNHHSKIK